MMYYLLFIFYKVVFWGGSMSARNVFTVVQVPVLLCVLLLPLNSDL